MEIEDLLKYFQTHKGYLKRSVSQIANRTHSRISDVIEAKRILRANKHEEDFKRAKLPKILIFDIETAPMKAYVWRVWKENISIDQTISDWFVICWSAKWLYSADMMSGCVTPEEAVSEDDSRIVKDLWKLFDEADMVVAHNGRKFDVPKMNSRFLVNGLNPPKPYYIIDTLQVAQKQFGFASNKLDALAVYFGYPRKLDTDFTLWSKCLEGDKESLDYMLEYNKQDVVLLEEVYLKLRPWIKNHPNVGNYLNMETNVCSTCGSDNVSLIEDKWYYTSVNKYHLYRCNCCGAISRGRKSVNNSVNLVSTMRD